LFSLLSPKRTCAERIFVSAQIFWADKLITFKTFQKQRKTPSYWSNDFRACLNFVYNLNFQAEAEFPLLGADFGRCSRFSTGFLTGRL